MSEYEDGYSDGHYDGQEALHVTILKLRGLLELCLDRNDIRGDELGKTIREVLKNES